MADKKMPDRRARPPSLIGELCLVNHPGGVVGKICPKIHEARQAENERTKQNYPVQPAFYCPRACRHPLAPTLSGMNTHSMSKPLIRSKSSGIDICPFMKPR